MDDFKQEKNHTTWDLFARIVIPGCVENSQLWLKPIHCWNHSLKHLDCIPIISPLHYQIHSIQYTHIIPFKSSIFEDFPHLPIEIFHDFPPLKSYFSSLNPHDFPLRNVLKIPMASAHLCIRPLSGDQWQRHLLRLPEFRKDLGAGEWRHHGRWIDWMDFWLKSEWYGMKQWYEPYFTIYCWISGET